MIVVSGALAIQLVDDVSAATHKACRLLDQSLFSTLVINVRLHKKTTHAGLRQLYRGMVEQLLNAWQRPRPGRPGMLVHKVPPLVNLVPV